MQLSLEEVEHIAKLARIELTEEEKARYREQLSAILDHVARLQKVDTSSVAPMTSVFPASATHRPDVPSGGQYGGSSHLRSDQPRPSLNTDELLKNAPSHEQDQFKIPPVFE